MDLSLTSDEIKISLDGHTLKKSTNFKDLGVMLGQENNTQIEINHWINKFISNIIPFIPTDERQTLHVKWALTSKIKNQLQAAEMKILRLIKRAARLDRLRNADIRRELEIENILDFVERGMEDSRYHKKNIWNEHHTREDLWNDNIELRKV